MTAATLFGGRPFVALVVTLIGMAATAGMGLWQLDRAAQKESLQRALQERSVLPEVDTREVAAASAADPSALLHRRARIAGRWITGRTVFLDNRQMNGRPGFYVLTPLVPIGAGVAVVVQRGWVPRDPVDPARLPALDTPVGDVIVVGRIAPPPSRLYEVGTAASGPIRHNLDLAAYASEIGAPLAPVSLLQESGPEDGLRRQWPQPALDVHKHYGYAFQWFALGALMAGFYVWYQILSPRLRRRA